MIALRKSVADQALPEPEHAGLWLDKYVREIEHDSGDKPHREELFSHAEGIKPSPIYGLAFSRWTSAPSIAKNRCYADLTVQAVGRLAVGLGGFNSLETSLTLHHTYGMPYLPGSALKGVLRHYLRERFGAAFADNGESASLLLGHAGEGARDGGALDEDELQALKGRALITLHDGWMIPDQARPQAPICLDVMTPHHPEYYTSVNAPWPAEYDQPIPINFVSIKPGIRFVIRLQGPDERWVKWVAEQLGEALLHKGIGAKTSAGYGRLETVGKVEVYAPAPERSEDYGEYERLIGAYEAGEGTVREKFEAVKEELAETLQLLEGRDQADALAHLKKMVRDVPKLKKLYQKTWLKDLEVSLEEG